MSDAVKTTITTVCVYTERERENFFSIPIQLCVNIFLLSYIIITVIITQLFEAT